MRVFNLEAAQPSYENYLRYFIAAQLWSLEDSSFIDFDMTQYDLMNQWKVGDEGDVGAFSDGYGTNTLKLKF